MKQIASTAIQLGALMMAQKQTGRRKLEPMATIQFLIADRVEVGPGKIMETEIITVMEDAEGLRALIGTLSESLQEMERDVPAMIYQGDLNEDQALILTREIIDLEAAKANIPNFGDAMGENIRDINERMATLAANGWPFDLLKARVEAEDRGEEKGAGENCGCGIHAHEFVPPAAAPVDLPHDADLSPPDAPSDPGTSDGGSADAGSSD